MLKIIEAQKEIADNSTTTEQKINIVEQEANTTLSAKTIAITNDLIATLKPQIEVAKSKIKKIQNEAVQAEARVINSMVDLNDLKQQEKFYHVLLTNNAMNYIDFETKLNRYRYEHNPNFTIITDLPQELLLKHSGIILIYIINNYPTEDHENLLLDLIKHTDAQNLDNLIDNIGNTILHLAIFQKNISDKVQLALIAKMSPDAIDKPNNYNWTALHITIHENISSKVQLALIAKMSVIGINQINADHVTALDLYHSQNHQNPTVINTLKEKIGLTK